MSICNSDHLNLEVAEHIERLYKVTERILTDEQIQQLHDGQGEGQSQIRASSSKQSNHSDVVRERQIADFVRDYQHFQEYSVYFLALNSMRPELDNGQPPTNADFLTRIGLTANLGHAQSTVAGIQLKVSNRAIVDVIRQLSATRYIQHKSALLLYILL